MPIIAAATRTTPECADARTRESNAAKIPSSAAAPMTSWNASSTLASRPAEFAVARSGCPGPAPRPAPAHIVRPGRPMQKRGWPRTMNNVSSETQPKMGACAELCNVLIQRVSPGTGANTTAASKNPDSQQRDPVSALHRSQSVILSIQPVPNPPSSSRVAACSCCVNSRAQSKVLLTRRHENLAFMGGLWVFPGGTLCPAGYVGPIARFDT